MRAAIRAERLPAKMGADNGSASESGLSQAYRLKQLTRLVHTAVVTVFSEQFILLPATRG